VEVVGPVDDVRSYLAAAAVVVAPLRIARGVQNKVLEAMACAKPVVCSPAAARGIEAEPGEHLLVADGPGQWVAVVSRLLDEPGLRRRIGAEARRCVERGYRWERRLEPMVRLLRGEPVEGVEGSSGWERTAA
jgi:glycosyltransferase involved in cell wall biosynthesis